MEPRVATPVNLRTHVDAVRAGAVHAADMWSHTPPLSFRWRSVCGTPCWCCLHASPSIPPGMSQAMISCGVERGLMHDENTDWVETGWIVRHTV